MPKVIRCPPCSRRRPDVLGAASDGTGVDRGTEFDHVLGLAARRCFDVCEDRIEIGLLALQEGVEESGRIRRGLCSGPRGLAAHLLEGDAGVTEQLIAELHALDQIDRDVLPRSVLLDRRVAAVQRDHPCLDGDVPTGDAGVVEQARMLEEHVDQLPEDVIGGLLRLLDDGGIVASDREGVFGGVACGAPAAHRDRQQSPAARLGQELGDLLLGRARG